MEQPIRTAAVDLVSTIVHVSLPLRSPVAVRAIDALIQAHGLVPSVDELAQSLGFKSRHQLACELSRAGVPPVTTLAGWLRVLLWLAEHELERKSLCRSSLEQSRDPAIGYRVVKRVTGLPWTTVRTQGLGWWAMEFVALCRAHDTRHGIPMFG